MPAQRPSRCLQLIGEMLCVWLTLATGLLTAAQAAPDFLLYTRRNAATPQRIRPEVESLLRSSFYALDTIVVSLPGAAGEESAAEQQLLAAALLQREPCNVFAVQLAGPESGELWTAVEHVTELLLLLHVQFDVPLERQQLVGFGLGAHLAGAVAEQVQRQLGEQLARITALDPSPSPAGSHQLSGRDARYVEVMHTNGHGLGSMQPLGHIDYYPNGGQQQPGCPATPDGCSHSRALQLAAEMWSPANEFVCAQCGTPEGMSAQSCRWTTHRMGLAEPASTGVYFLETESSKPYGRGAYHIDLL